VRVLVALVILYTTQDSYALQGRTGNKKLPEKKDENDEW